MATYKIFEELSCWKPGHSVRLCAMETSKKIPKHEQYSLVDNMKRAARSSARNIAEGFGRRHNREDIQR